MKTILHLGAHRTGSTSLQRTMGLSRGVLADHGVALWTPEQTRDGRLAGVTGQPKVFSPNAARLERRAKGRVDMARQTYAQRGMQRLVISDENLLGGLRENTGLSVLYPTVTRRMERAARYLGPVDRIAVVVRSLDAWWTSAHGYLITRGYGVPDRDVCDCIVTGPRRWQHVITDVARAFPAADVVVWSFEAWATQPNRACAGLTGMALPNRTKGARLNATPPADVLEARFDTGPLPRLGQRFAPFDADQRRALRAQYAQDIAWLRAGADGLARFIDHDVDQGAQDPGRSRYDTEGISDDRSHQAMG